MKNILFILTLFSFNFAFAQHLEVNLTPENPLVMSSDLTIQDSNGELTEILGPWFKILLDFDNKTDQDITISHMLVFVRESSNQNYEFHQQIDGHDLGGIIEMTPFTSYSTGPLFISSLPSSNTNYDIKLVAHGWGGTAKSPDKKIEITFFFKTQ